MQLVILPHLLLRKITLWGTFAILKKRATLPAGGEIKKHIWPTFNKSFMISFPFRQTRLKALFSNHETGLIQRRCY